MREQHYLEKRITRGYKSCWRHLDVNECIGMYSHLNNRVTEEDGENVVVCKTIRVDPYPDTDMGDVRDALFDAFDEDCDCEYDCCGHWFGGAKEVKHVKGKEWFVRCTYSRNY